jgi:hypothetical protein
MVHVFMIILRSLEELHQCQEFADKIQDNMSMSISMEIILSQLLFRLQVLSHLIDVGIYIFKWSDVIQLIERLSDVFNTGVMRQTQSVVSTMGQLAVVWRIPSVFKVHDNFLACLMELVFDHNLELAVLHILLWVEKNFYWIIWIYVVWIFNLQPSNDPYAFTLTGDVGAVDPALLGTNALQQTTCATDFVVIPAARQNNILVAGGDRFCGLGIAATESFTRPFVIYSYTDANETPDIGNRGWSLTYTQNMCPV